jgi:hypothetical protein
LSLDTGRYQLYSSWKTLQERWAETDRYWRDAVRRQFEEQYWVPLEPAVLGTLIAVDRLAQVLVQARNDCG